jgi:nitroreductase
VVGDPEVKAAIRDAAEAEERENYLGGRLPPDWLEALAPLGTDENKPYLEIAPWLVVLFEERYQLDADGTQRKNFYVKESVGIAAGMFVAAVHNAGLATLPHTPSPMAFLAKVLGRPGNERPFALFPVGYPAPDCVVPDIHRKPLHEVIADSPAGSR